MAGDAQRADWREDSAAAPVGGAPVGGLVGRHSIEGRHSAMPFQSLRAFDRCQCAPAGGGLYEGWKPVNTMICRCGAAPEGWLSKAGIRGVLPLPEVRCGCVRDREAAVELSSSGPEVCTSESRLRGKEARWRMSFGRQRGTVSFYGRQGDPRRRARGAGQES